MIAPRSAAGAATRNPPRMAGRAAHSFTLRRLVQAPPPEARTTSRDVASALRSPRPVAIRVVKKTDNAASAIFGPSFGNTTMRIGAIATSGMLKQAMASRSTGPSTAGTRSHSTPSRMAMRLPQTYPITATRNVAVTLGG